MKKGIGVLLTIMVLASVTFAAGVGNPTSYVVDTAALNALYCQLAGCDMAGDIDMNGNEIADSTGYLNIGGTATSGYGLGVGDVVIGGKLEMKGNLYPFDIIAIDNRWLKLGSASDDILGHSSTQTPDTLFLGIGAVSNNFLIAEAADVNNNFAHAQSTNPTLILQSASTTAAYHLKMYHDQTDGVISVGSGDIKLDDEVEATGVSGDGTGKVVCIKGDGNLGTCSDAPNGSGECTCG